MSLKDILEKFPKAKVLIVGDLILDRFVYGESKRISPEAPVPVVEVKHERYQLGGAGNVANNIISLGGSVSIAGIVGNDYSAEILLKELNKKNIDIGGIFTDSTIKTSIKTRVIAGHQQVVRFDRETVRELSPSMTEKIMQFINKKIPEVDAVLISDYGKGVVTQKIISEIIRLTKKYKKLVTVDPKIEHFSRYKFVDCLTPNIYEAMNGAGVSKLKNENDLKNLGRKILKKLKCRSVIITRGENGMTLFEKEKISHIPTTAKEVFDVTGAGDTVIAVLTLALSCGASLTEASKIANYAAGIVVGKLGTATVSKEELKKSVAHFVK
ncbi:MAG: D-glycero-beta-D-manno-heptose-7-phosphate kinase [Elusimicrobia bacterium HGW-Elusimicrobia-4]|nr:MAG: D-glycero-beta-D-manno-heptose-7-phosphate kinase [Elusimicrobia bacterium HGW-Elusimicrobia-4]